MKNEIREEILSAKWIFPIRRPPINGGFLRLVNGTVVEIGRQSDRAFRRADVMDLGDVALIPGLVNAHTHLEFSDLEEPVGEREIRLSDWIRQVISQRGATSETQRRQNIETGIKESTDAGVAVIGDIATTPSVYPGAPGAQLVSFAEVLGLTQERAEERLASAEEHVSRIGSDSPIRCGVSPHAPYSTPESLIERCIELSVRVNAPLAMHVAESAEERELMENASGPFADMLRNSGFWREGLFPWEAPEPLSDLIDRLARAPRALLVHGNYFRTSDIEQISRHPNLSVVYCPRTHAFFDHPPHPVERLRTAGVRVALGTDSRASNPDLSVWGEIQFLLNHRQDLDPMSVLEMGTSAGADALLGVGSGYGRIDAGFGQPTPLVAIRTAAATLEQVWADFAENGQIDTALGQLRDPS